jgi:hypothetical protein
MISCTEFIPAYSEGFKYFEKLGGRKALEKFWSFLSDTYLRDTLSKLVEDDGLDGCYTYWSHSLNEEAADFKMVLNEIAGEFRIDMYKCPSRAMLNELKHMEPYHSYCDHCPALYSPIVQRLGYTYLEDLSRCQEATCYLTIKVNK